MRAGIAMSSKVVENESWAKYARIIASELKLYGAWFFQMKEDKNSELKLMEIAPRIGGTMATNRVTGVNFALLSVYEQARCPISILTNNIEITIDRALTNRYYHNLSYDTVYLDFDDTLVIRSEVNTLLMSLVYQFRNQGKKIILITKCKDDIRQMLKKYAIAEDLFQKIIHLSADDFKPDHIKIKSSIFIDDSFSERKKVSETCEIPTFDCSMIEMLIDERI